MDQITPTYIKIHGCYLVGVFSFVPAFVLREQFFDETQQKSTPPLLNVCLYGDCSLIPT